MVLYSAVSSPLDRSKRFTLSSPGRPVHSDTVLGFSWKHSSHAAIAQRLFTHISTTVYSQDVYMFPWQQDEKVLRTNKRYHIVDTNKNGVRFRNSALLDLNTEYLQARDDYEQQQKGVVAEVISIAGQGS